MDKVLSFLNSVPGWLKPVGAIVGVICLIAAGIMMQTGTENAAKAKKWMGYVCIGVAIIFLAASVVAMIQGAAE